jgi:hypothetical protein
MDTVIVKIILLVGGILSGCIGVLNLEIAPAIVSGGALIAYALLEIAELKSKK